MMVFAGNALAQSMTIERVNKQGIVGRDVLKKQNNVYFISGKKVGTKLPPKIQTKWNKVYRTPASLETVSQGRPCSLGTFKISVQDVSQKKSKIYKGCASGPEYGKFLSEVYELRSFAKAQARN